MDTTGGQKGKAIVCCPASVHVPSRLLRHFMTKDLRPILAVLALTTAFPVLAQVNAGVSDERVRLPQAPGSVSGVGENASVEGNQGAVQYEVRIEVPPGFKGVTPELALSYSSNGGASVVGVGWSMPRLSIDRMTSKGLQRYGIDDRFAAEGSTELVRVAQTATSATYRARDEGAFVRYTWLDRGLGESGWWKAEYPDGRVGYYGADKTGVTVGAARVSVPATPRTFSWRLVLMEDAWGHQMKVSWTRDASGTPLVERIDYLFEGTLPRHSVRFTYEGRTDVVSDATPGFELLLTQRLKDIRVFSGTTAAEQIRRYELQYEPAATSGGTTRLASVSRFGLGDARYPVKFTFAYSKALGGACTGNCEKPFTRDMGQVGGVNFTNGRSSFVDVNGDAIPDVLFTDDLGVHRFFYGRLDSEGRASFDPTPVLSTRTVGGSPFVLGRSSVQLLDVNGDGFVDLTEARLRLVLCNNGSGDWVDASFCSPTVADAPATFVVEADPPNQQDPRYVRFFDYDNDKRIDWLRTSPGTGDTQVLINSTMGLTPAVVDTIGLTFDESPLELADMNGDGLQDPVSMTVSGAVVNLQYKLNLGLGRWSTTWRTLTFSFASASQAAQLALEDINGDGLADVVSVTGNEVALALNVNGTAFAPPMTLRTADLGSGSIPQRTSTTTVSYADMNGNGSADIVWLEDNGTVRYLELFPVRPNLITRIDNGLGAVQLFSYGTSIVEQARDSAANAPWPNRVPNASVVVTLVDSFVTLTGSDSGGLHERVAYRYHAGFYDGVEKQFRGYESVEREVLGSAMDAEEPSLTVTDFDVGKTNPALAAHQRKRAVFSLASPARVLVRETRNLLEACPVAEVPPNTTISFVCDRAETTIVFERDATKALTLEEQREYDGYGNVVRETNLGVKHLGTPESPRGCASCVASGLFGQACGALCEGDERFTTRTFVTPGTSASNPWQLDKPSRVTSGALLTAQNVETRTFYDGPDFVGLPAGELTRGGVTRVTRRVGPGAADFIEVQRHALDAHGNPVVAIEPIGSLTGTSNRRLYTYEPAGRWVTQAEVRLEGSTSLRRDLAHETAFEEVSQISNWYPVSNGQPAAQPQTIRFRYDEHGRVSRKVEPGETDATASTEYQYELADPASRILTLRRSTATGAHDLVTANCLDGRGRSVQTRAKLSATEWQVSGFTEYDQRGAAVRVFQPYTSTSGACETSPPQGVPSTRFGYDVLQRKVSEVEPDGSTLRTEFAPLVSRFFDEDDTDASSPFANTPTIETTDGLGRLVSIERTLPAGAPSAATRLGYDAEGQLFTVTDPAGHQHLQRYDLMGRATQVTDVNSGVMRFEYDASGNRVRTTDARNVSVRSRYDAFNRLVAQWDEADEPNSRVQWTWDLTTGCLECSNAGGLMAQVDWKNGATPARDRFGYDVRGRLVFQERTLEGRPLTTRFRYDTADRLIATQYPAGLTLEQTYDGASRIVGLPGYLNRVSYTPRGLPGELEFFNGVKTTREYDSRLRLARLKTQLADASAVFDLSYTRSRRGDLLRLDDAATRQRRVRHAAVFQHDAWSRLTRAELTSAEGDPEVLSFTFDAIDNILSQTSSRGSASRAHVGSYEYDPSRFNAVVKAGSLTLRYDAAGALIGRGSTELERDHLGRVVRATRDGAQTGAFFFGHGTQRVVKQEGDFTTWYLEPNFEVRDGIGVLNVRLGGERVARAQTSQLAATLLSDLAPTRDGAPAGDSVIDVGDAWVAQAASIGALTLSGGPTPSPVKALLASAARRLLVDDVVFLHTDHLESVVASTNVKGALVAEQSFFPTGGVRSASGFVDVYGFTGQESDESTGLTHFEHRELDAATGRWASVDPAFSLLDPDAVKKLGEATTAYAYVANDFVDDIDPDGQAKSASKAPAKTVGSTLGVKLVRMRPGFKKTPDRGGKPGSRPGIDFTKAGKDEVLQRAAMKHKDKIARCENSSCNVKLEVPAKSMKGVTPSPNEAQVDHIKSAFKGGSGDPSNGQALCRTCNRMYWWH